MSNDLVAQRYAETLLDLASERGEVELILAQLDRLREVAKLTPELSAALSNPGLDDAAKKHLLATALPEAPQVLLDFFSVLVDRQRATHAIAIADAFRTLAEEQLSVVDVHVTSAVALTAAEESSLQQRLAVLTGATVRLSVAVERDLIGGLVVRIGDRRIDLSIRTRLDRLREQMVGH
ncbi:MAG: ATP synthase F1 subunit delta [Chloroflexota bacterium]